MILPTSWFPPVSYIAECLHTEELIIEYYETFPKQTYRNRCAIYGPNGKQILIVPVKKPDGNHTLTKEIRIDNKVPWQKLHWRSIETAYNNSPFFLYYRDIFEIFFKKRFDFLTDLNTEILYSVFKLLGKDRKINYTQAYSPEDHSFAYEQILNKHFFPSYSPYTQVFSAEKGFFSNLSILDCLFNLGKDTADYCSCI
ncbi:MAG: WbqC family protein [Bacteroidota bacterium]|nr:WbqC family protein [Bacteroidota bacterium]